MKRRYDSGFFVVAMPSGQVCRHDGRETTHELRISPEILSRQVNNFSLLGGKYNMNL
jgi:hypothetical protein